MTTTRSRASRLRQRASIGQPNGATPSVAPTRPPDIEPPVLPAAPVLSRIGVEPALYALAIALATLTRFGSLAVDPLAPWETTTALAARALALGAPDGGSAPLPEVVMAVFFFLFGPTEFTARLGAALAGIALVGLLPLLRPSLGRVAALIAAFMVALSPLAWGVSRRADGEAMALLAGVVVALALFRLNDDRQRDRWLGVGAVALACLLTAGPRGITVMIALLAFAALARVAGGDNRFSGLLAAARASDWRRGGPLFWAVGIGVLVYAVISTRLFSQPGGAALPSLRLWINEFAFEDGGATTALALASYEPLAVIIGIVGVVRLALRRAAEPRDAAFVALLATWAVVAAIIALLGGQATLGPLAAIGLPLTLLAATTLADWALTIRWREIGRAAVVLGVVPLLVFAYLSLAAYTRLDSVQPVPWLTLALTLGLATAYLTFVAYATGRDGPPVVGLTVAGVALLLSLHTAIELNVRASAAEWILPDVSGPAARLVPDHLAAIAAARGGAVTYGVAPAVTQPMAWHTRALPNRVASSAFGPTMQAFVAPADAPPPADAIVVQRAVYSIEPSGPPPTARDFVRWFMWRDATGPRVERVAVLYRRP